jgi:hypothetical protein
MEQNRKMGEGKSYAERTGAPCPVAAGRYLATFAFLFMLAGCGGGSPQLTSIYTPVPRQDVYGEVLAKVKEMGYTIIKEDAETGHVLGQKPSAIEGEKDEIDVWIGLAPESTQTTKVSVTASRVIPASGQEAEKRIAANSNTNRDGLAVIGLYNRIRRPPSPS